ncbi:MAG: helix-turn-helix domain-containing protein [Eubacteriales bacterium]|nr:helix-turn-helix domain-containing protein [Eubacteriales bacterium]
MNEIKKIISDIKIITIDSRINCSERITLIAMYANSNNSKCYLQSNELADVLDKSIRQIQRELRTLIDLGYIERAIEDGESCYILKGFDGSVEGNLADVPKRYNYKKIVDRFNEVAEKTVGISRVLKLTNKRKEKLKKRLDEIGEDELIKAFDCIKESDFLQGKNSNGWRVSFDWLIENDTNAVKVLEGKYADKAVKKDDFPFELGITIG